MIVNFIATWKFFKYLSIIYTKHYNLDLLLPSFFLTPTEVGKGEYEQMESGHF